MIIADILENSGAKVRSYDKLLNFVHFNPRTHALFVSLVNLNMFLQISLSSRNIEWVLPSLKDSFPLCAHSDQDKLVIAYDSNKILVLDLLNKRIHDWSRRNPADKFPQNFLNRFNRIVGIT